MHRITKDENNDASNVSVLPTRDSRWCRLRLESAAASLVQWQRDAGPRIPVGADLPGTATERASAPRAATPGSAWRSGWVAALNLPCLPPFLRLRRFIARALCGASFGLCSLFSPSDARTRAQSTTLTPRSAPEIASMSSSVLLDCARGSAMFALMLTRVHLRRAHPISASSSRKLSLSPGPTGCAARCSLSGPSRAADCQFPYSRVRRIRPGPHQLALPLA